MGWGETRQYADWASFRDNFYYPEVVGRPYDGTPNLKKRAGDQTGEQAIHDLWREHMGFNAPWTDVMVFYDHGRPIALGEIKRGIEGWANANRRATEVLAGMARLPLLLLRWLSPSGPVEVSVFHP